MVLRENKKEFVVKVKVSEEIKNWIDSSGHKGKVTSQALEFYHDYLFYKKGFFVRLIDLNFDLAKYILRKLGRTKNEV